MKTMHAVTFDTFGPPEVLRWTEQAMPTPGPGEVLIRVAAATVNPTDLLMRGGQHASVLTAIQPPYIAGMELAGHVGEVGGADGRLHVGQAVMAIVNPRRQQGGAYAQYVCVPFNSVVPVPAGVSLAEAATVPMNGMTACLCIEMLALKPGASLLVTGGAGALGAYVIEIARRSGLHVIADAKESDRQFLSRIGANAIVPRGEGMREAVQALFPGGVDGLVDAALLGDSAVDLVRSGGAAILVRTNQVVRDDRVRCIKVLVPEHVHRLDILQRLSTMLEARQLTPRVALRMPAQQAAQAHERLAEGGLRGRIVLEF